MSAAGRKSRRPYGLVGAGQIVGQSGPLKMLHPPIPKRKTPHSKEKVQPKIQESTRTTHKKKHLNFKILAKIEVVEV
jgi:hypothetical protein